MRTLAQSGHGPEVLELGLRQLVNSNPEESRVERRLRSRGRPLHIREIDGRTCCALDPALWFYGKHGCNHCENVKRRVRFGRACDSCLFPVSAPSGQRGTALFGLLRHLLQ